MKRVKIGVVGCGAIAQVHHTPNLNALPDQFKLAVVRDVSPSAAADAARRFHVPRHVTDYRELLAADEDAVLLCHTDPKTEAAIAVLEAGKHLFIEKPLCFSLPDIDAMIAAQGAGTVAQAGYMKVYDPTCTCGSSTCGGSPTPAAASERTAAVRKVAVRQALGDAPPDVVRAFNLLSGSNDPRPVRHARHAGSAGCRGERRDLAGGPRRHLYPGVSEPRPLRTHLDRPTRPVGLQGDPGDPGHRRGRRAPSPRWTGRVPTLRELRHFHECIVDGTANRTPLAAPATTSAWSSTS